MFCADCFNWKGDKGNILGLCDLTGHYTGAYHTCEIVGVEIPIYDEEEIHENCTVQILRNSVTGETSIGWWENDR